MTQPNLRITISDHDSTTLTDFINLYRGKRSRQVSFKITPQQHQTLDAYAVAFDMTRAELAYRGFIATVEHLTRYHPLPPDVHKPGYPVQQLSLFE